MGGQGIERREILRFIGLASVAATYPGFNQWSFACAREHAHAAAAPAPATPYRPLFFNAQQYQMIERLAEIILPADETPGAKEAGVAEFIDFMVANRVPVTGRHEVRSTQDAIRMGEEAQQQFVSGLGWMNARGRSEFGHEFMSCSREQQTQLIEELAYKAKFTPTTERGREFFQMMRHYTVVGYYTTKVGLESLGYPGLRSVWPQMPGCSHPNDPEHAFLREPMRNELAVLNGAK
jgi:gluconate 2-dehydrogenase gamma chain